MALVWVLYLLPLSVPFLPVIFLFALGTFFWWKQAKLDGWQAPVSCLDRVDLRDRNLLWTPEL